MVMFCFGGFEDDFTIEFLPRTRASPCNIIDVMTSLQCNIIMLCALPPLLEIASPPLPAHQSDFTTLTNVAHILGPLILVAQVAQQFFLGKTVTQHAIYNPKSHQTQLKHLNAGEKTFFIPINPSTSTTKIKRSNFTVFVTPSLNHSMAKTLLAHLPIYLFTLLIKHKKWD